VTVDPLTLVAAIAIPVVGLAALIGLVRAVTDLERSRDEMIEVATTRR
jgi:hypothetical protein